jgi:hypothetical protein
MGILNNSHKIMQGTQFFACISFHSQPAGGMFLIVEVAENVNDDWQR